MLNIAKIAGFRYVRPYSLVDLYQPFEESLLPGSWSYKYETASAAGFEINVAVKTKVKSLCLIKHYVTNTYGVDYEHCCVIESDAV
jgi:hypothetical protein